MGAKVRRGVIAGCIRGQLRETGHGGSLELVELVRRLFPRRGVSGRASTARHRCRRRSPYLRTATQRRCILGNITTTRMCLIDAISRGISSGDLLFLLSMSANGRMAPDLGSGLPSLTSVTRLRDLTPLHHVTAGSFCRGEC